MVADSDADDPAVAGALALQRGRWSEAREAFEASTAVGDSGGARLGLGKALWWLGENQPSVDQCTAAYAMFRRHGDVAGAVDAALWLGLTYKANFANFVAAEGWIARAERLLAPIPTGPAHGWSWITRAYQLADLDAAEQLAQRALELARTVDDVDLELTAASMLGLIKVRGGDTDGGFALIDEAMAGALGGEPSNLDTVVYTCCDMLNACEVAGDLERATQWCAVADRFVATYGCPFLYAECRILYGGVLTTAGRWTDAERELAAGIRLTAESCPALYAKAAARLATLRIRQGRLEAAGRLLTGAGGDGADNTLAAAELLLARGDGEAAGRLLTRHLSRIGPLRSRRIAALGLLVDAHLSGGEVADAAAVADRLAAAAETGGPRGAAAVAAARGRVAARRGDNSSATALLDEAAGLFEQVGAPYESARARADLGRALAADDRDLAVQQAGRALAGFRRLGAALEADRVEAVLRSLGVARTGRRRPGALTDRERDVLRLLTDGLTNPQIAERLFVSRKTVAHHVSSILTKLNVPTRTAAAACAGELLEMGQMPDAPDDRLVASWRDGNHP